MWVKRFETFDLFVEETTHVRVKFSVVMSGTEKHLNCGWSRFSHKFSAKGLPPAVQPYEQELHTFLLGRYPQRPSDMHQEVVLPKHDFVFKVHGCSIYIAENNRVTDFGVNWVYARIHDRHLILRCTWSRRLQTFTVTSANLMLKESLAIYQTYDELVEQMKVHFPNSGYLWEDPEAYEMIGSAFAPKKPKDQA